MMPTRSSAGLTTSWSVRTEKQPFAVLSIGGFLGMGTHLVVVPYDSLKLCDNKMLLPGGSKEGLRTLPTFRYATE